MNRRDFLLLRRERKDRVVEVSCQRLYLGHVDARAGAARGAGEEGAADPEWWSGEPPTRIARPTLPELLQGLEAELSGADVLRVVDGDWLVSEELRRAFDTVLTAFRARGGRVEYR